MIWAVKDSSISSVFVDAGAGEFLVEKINSSGQTSLEDENPVKRMKFTVNRNEGEGSTHLGSALGPDWHKGFSKAGRSEGKQVHVEYKVEIGQILSHSDLLSRNLSETAGIVTEGEQKISNIILQSVLRSLYVCQPLGWKSIDFHPTLDLVVSRDRIVIHTPFLTPFLTQHP